jgi:dihydrofolate synthase/folylpolyglutamate synthase
LEVGLGGRLDATNVVERPVVGAITRIALDHTERLGTTLETIAREKAGIAKPGLEIVVGPMEPGVERAIEHVVHAVGGGARVVRAVEATADIAVPSPALRGRHQLDNARVAWVLAERAGIPEQARRAGLAAVRWPGRLERLDTPEGAVLLDAAHNPDGVQALAAELRGETAPVVLVFGALADKAWEPMIDTLAPLTRARIYVAPTGRAAVDPERIARRRAGEVAATFSEGYRRARAAAGSHGVVVVTGSILLVGEARSELLGVPRDPPVAL